MKTLPFICLSLALAAAQSVFADDFQSDGVKIHYTVTGSGAPVILIHGLFATAQWNWGLPGVIAELAKTRQVIALDCRGHGQSDKPGAAGAYGIKMVEDVVRLMDHLKIPQADVAGYSMGGMIAMKLLVLHPERIRSAVLGGMGWLQGGGLLQGFWANIDNGKPAAGNGAGAACMKGFAEFAVTENQLRDIKVPLAVVVGHRDPCKALYVDPLRKVRPDVPVKVIEDAGHVSCLLKPGFKSAVNDLLAPAGR
jgi:pimeloyl-ACP methyl ester carboxylesterase